MAMPDETISNLPEATSVDNDQVFPIEDGLSSKKMKIRTLKEFFEIADIISSLTNKANKNADNLSAEDRSAFIAALGAAKSDGSNLTAVLASSFLANLGISVGTFSITTQAGASPSAQFYIRIKNIGVSDASGDLDFLILVGRQSLYGTTGVKVTRAYNVFNNGGFKYAAASLAKGIISINGITTDYNLEDFAISISNPPGSPSAGGSKSMSVLLKAPESQATLYPSTFVDYVLFGFIETNAVIS